MSNETKRVPVVTTEFDEQTGTLAVVFSDGRRHSFLLENTAPEIRLRATIHGFNAKLVDAARATSGVAMFFSISSMFMACSTRFTDKLFASYHR